MAQVRLLPAMMVTLGVVLALRAAAVAEEAVGAGAAQSEGAAAPAAPASGAAPPADPAAAATDAAAQAQCPPATFADQAGLSQTEVRVLQSLGERRKQLDARAADIDAKATLLEAAQKRMDERVAELKRLEASIQSLMQDLDAQELERITALVSVYQRMRAKDAAAVFNGLEEEVLVEVASRMKQQNLAEIMGEMAPDRARRLTILLAQHKRPPATAAEALGQAPARPAPAAAQPAPGQTQPRRAPATAG